MSNLSNMVDIPDLALVLKDDAAIAKWSESRVNEFVDTYKKRVNAARTILYGVAREVFFTAKQKHFLAQDADVPLITSYHHLSHGACSQREFTGRSSEDLDAVIKQRSKEILSELPPLKTVTKIISPEMTKKLDRIDKLRATLRECKAELEGLARVIHMSDYADMLVKDFIAMVEENKTQREVVVKKLEKTALECNRLQEEVDKYFYSGIPGLSDEVLRVCNGLVDQARVLDESVRKVEETLKFGDSKLAAELLSQFDVNENSVSGDTAVKFKEALEQLKLSRSQVKKAVAKKKVSKTKA